MTLADRDAAAIAGVEKLRFFPLAVVGGQGSYLLAEDLLRAVPGTGERRVWLSHSGSDANDTAVRTIEAATGRRRFISIAGAYHGGTLGSMGVSGHSSQDPAMARPGLVQLPYPDPYRSSEDAGPAVLRELDQLLAADVDPEEVAALFLEPIRVQRIEGNKLGWLRCRLRPSSSMSRER